VKVTVFALPEVAGVMQKGEGGGETELVQGAGEEIFTVGAGKIVTVEVAERFWSSNDTAATVTVLGIGTEDGAW
jgi:microcystin-dependent protein